MLSAPSVPSPVDMLMAGRKSIIVVATLVVIAGPRFGLRTRLLTVVLACTLGPIVDGVVTCPVETVGGAKSAGSVTHARYSRTALEPCADAEPSPENPTEPAIVLRNVDKVYENAAGKFRALKSGGTIAIGEWLVNDERTKPLPSLMFSVQMLVNTEKGDTFSFNEIKQWLEEAGFKKVRKLKAPGPSPLILATKP